MSLLESCELALLYGKGKLAGTANQKPLNFLNFFRAPNRLSFAFLVVYATMYTSTSPSFSGRRCYWFTVTARGNVDTKWTGKHVIAKLMIRALMGTTHGLCHGS